MDTTSIYTIIITLITVLGSASAWRFYEKRSAAKEKIENALQDDCRDRIVKLEVLLEKSSNEKEEMRKQILTLTGMVAELKTKVEFLEKENNEYAEREHKTKRHITKRPTK